MAHAFNDIAGALQQAETLRRHLIADVAHELRTPLSVLQGNLNAMLDGLYPLDMQEIATLYDQTRLLTRLVDDLHELAQAEAGQLPLHLTVVEADALLWATATRFNTVADAQAITIEVSVPLSCRRCQPIQPYDPGVTQSDQQCVAPYTNGGAGHDCGRGRGSCSAASALVSTTRRGYCGRRFAPYFRALLPRR